MFRWGEREGEDLCRFGFWSLGLLGLCSLEQIIAEYQVEALTQGWRFQVLVSRRLSAVSAAAAEAELACEEIAQAPGTWKNWGV